VLKKVNNVNLPHVGPAPEGSHAIERDGSYLLRGEFAPDEITRLREEIIDVYRRYPPDMRAGASTPERAEMFRYEMFNRSALCQQAIARAAVLEILAPILGHDFHAISCTSWRNPPGNAHAPRGQDWHIDAGPHVPRPAGIPWPANIPYPIFVVATHIYLQDVHIEDGPTAVAPGSHKSGQLPPDEHRWDLDLRYDGRQPLIHIAKAGDVGFFVSDSWHRRMPPAPHAGGRFFLQTNFGRRDIAQRILPTDRVNHTNAEARARAKTMRERQLIGLHEQVFYDG
jgi:hypothetical protein